MDEVLRRSATSSSDAETEGGGGDLSGKTKTSSDALKSALDVLFVDEYAIQGQDPEEE